MNPMEKQITKIHMEVMCLHEVYIWAGHRSVLSFILHKSIFLHFVHHGTIFYDKYITSYDISKSMDDDGSGVFPKTKS